MIGATFQLFGNLKAESLPYLASERSGETPRLEDFGFHPTSAPSLISKLLERNV
jgi:hypothetical protein